MALSEILASDPGLCIVSVIVSILTKVPSVKLPINAYSMAAEYFNKGQSLRLPVFQPTSESSTRLILETLLRLKLRKNGLDDGMPNQYTTANSRAPRI